MRLLVVSDSHGDRDILIELVKTYQGKVDAMIHCGDSELAETDSVWGDMQSVKGNMDFDQSYPELQTREIGQEKIVWVHGHLHDVKKSMQTLVSVAKEANAKFAFFGHTHELGAERIDGILVLNPGSILLPRGAHKIKTYAIIETTKDTVQVMYYNRLHQLIEELSCSFARE